MIGSSVALFSSFYFHLLYFSSSSGEMICLPDRVCQAQVHTTPTVRTYRLESPLNVPKRRLNLTWDPRTHGNIHGEPTRCACKSRSVEKSFPLEDPRSTLDIRAAALFVPREEFLVGRRNLCTVHTYINLQQQSFNRKQILLLQRTKEMSQTS